MAGENSLSSKRDLFWRNLSILLSTPLEAIDTWGAFLKCEQEAVGLLHDAINLRSNYCVDFAVQGVDVNSGTPSQIQQEFGQATVHITGFRQSLIGVKERLNGKGISPSVAIQVVTSTTDVKGGVPDALAAGADLRATDPKRHAPDCKEVPSEVQTEDGVRPTRKRKRPCVEIQGGDRILEFLVLSGWSRSRSTFYSRMKTENRPPCWRKGKELVGRSCALRRWAEIQSAH